jgi:hypothetical protein
MNLLDRYIHEVGRYLPRRNREDIQVELRSAIDDTLEDRFGPQPNVTQLTELLKEFGRPQEVASSYHPQDQYLIGPGYYPLFRLIIGIVLAAVLASQLLAWFVAGVIVGDQIAPWEALAGLLNSLPAALGWVVLVFVILQRFEVHPEGKSEEWDPNTLPQIRPEEEIKRVGLIVSLVISILILVVVLFFPQWIGFVVFPGRRFYPNPVIRQYLGWITVSLLSGIGLDIFLLRQGRWSLGTRMAKIIVNTLSIVVLLLLYQGHTAWLVARSTGNFIYTLELFPELLEEGWELVGMQAFRLAFGVALIVTVIETLTATYRLVRSRYQSEITPGKNIAYD